MALRIGSRINQEWNPMWVLLNPTLNCRANLDSKPLSGAMRNTWLRCDAPNTKEDLLSGFVTNPHSIVESPGKPIGWRDHLCLGPDEMLLPSHELHLNKTGL